MRRAAALIVGGGPAGTTAAMLLADAGHAPVLLERDAAPQDALCGGFLSWRTLDQLRAIGLDTDALGGAKVDRVRLCHGGRSVEAALPGPAIGLSRRTLDAALIAEAAKRGAGIERGVKVRAAEDQTLLLDDGGSLVAERLLLATGKHELRGLARPRDAAGDDPAVGIRLRLAPSPAHARMIGGVIELHLFAMGYGGLVLQEDGAANLCLAVRASRLRRVGGRPEALIAELAREAPLLGARLGAGSIAGPIQTIAHLPYGWRAGGGSAGLYRLGDQAGVIPSLAGEGIGIALASGRIAAEAIARGEDGTCFQQRLSGRLRRPIGIARLLWEMAERPGLARPMLAMAARFPGLLDPLARATRIGH